MKLHIKLYAVSMMMLAYNCSNIEQTLSIRIFGINENDFTSRLSNRFGKIRAKFAINIDIHFALRPNEIYGFQLKFHSEKYYT